jgi:hypothetical protein
VISSYSTSIKSFENISKLSISIYKIEDIDILNFNKVIFEIIKLLNRNDEDDQILASQLWVCKTIVNATLINYNDPALMLIERLNSISKLLIQLSINVNLINKFKSLIVIIVEKKSNKKFEKLLSISKESNNNCNKSGIVGRNLFGYDPACFDFFVSNISNYGFKFDNIKNRSQLFDFNFSKIIIVGSPNKSSLELMRAVFYSGTTSKIDVFLYDHENFSIPPRVEIPIQSELKNLIKKINFKNIKYDNSEISEDESELNNWIEDEFLTNIHAGSQIKTNSTVPSHYILFENGEGAFMPVNGKILHLNKKKSFENSYSSEYELSYIDILELEEGDYVLLRTNDCGFLVNEELSGDEDEDDEGVLDKITTWKTALDALLLTKDYSQIADLLSAMGVKVNSAKIKQWNGINVIAPNSEEEFKGLINLLNKEGKLNTNIKDVDQYASYTWKGIVDYRVSRQKAGTKVRSKILDNLLLKIKGVDLFSANTNNNLDFDLGQNLLIRRISTFDRNVAYVHTSDLFKINELRNFRWLR